MLDLGSVLFLILFYFLQLNLNMFVINTLTVTRNLGFVGW